MDIKKTIEDIEAQMALPEFWNDKERAQTALREHASLKAKLADKDKFEKGNTILTVFAGAGGDDAEDFARMIFDMYVRYVASRGWEVELINKSENDHGGYRNITVEIKGKGAYGTLKNESGVHRLVRISPFNAKKLRHTAFAMAEFIPKFDKTQNSDVELLDRDLQISIAKAGGPGGQNVNKRETAVRIVHIPSKLSVHVTSERSQIQNKEKALEILRGKLFKLQEDERIAKEKGMYISKSVDAEWGNQIRSYVLHPYKMVKDHRTDVETAKVDDVFAGDLEIFIETEKGL